MKKGRPHDNFAAVASEKCAAGQSTPVDASASTRVALRGAPAKSCQQAMQTTIPRLTSSPQTGQRWFFVLTTSQTIPTITGPTGQMTRNGGQKLGVGPVGAHPS